MSSRPVAAPQRAGGAAEPWWWSAEQVAASDVRLLRLGGRAALFAERAQQLFELNATAERIWRSLADARAPAAVAEELCADHVPEAQASAFVEGCAREWLGRGWIAPVGARPGEAEIPDAQLHLRVDELACSVRLHGKSADRMERLVRSVFGQFEGQAAPGALQTTLVERAGEWLLFVDDAPRGLFAAEAVAPQLKALVTEQLAGSLEDGSFLIHAALLKTAGGGLLITGGPGAGKTTLAAALAAEGFPYCTDDVVRVRPDGALTGVRFSLAVKSGGWPLLVGDALEAPVHVRADGQAVRYVPPAGPDPGPVERVRLALSLARTDAAEPRAEPLEPMALLVELLGGAYSPANRLDGGVLAAFTRTLAPARCARLLYADLPQAVSLIHGLLDG